MTPPHTPPPARWRGHRHARVPLENRKDSGSSATSTMRGDPTRHLEEQRATCSSRRRGAGTDAWPRRRTCWEGPGPLVPGSSVRGPPQMTCRGAQDCPPACCCLQVSRTVTATRSRSSPTAFALARGRRVLTYQGMNKLDAPFGIGWTTLVVWMWGSRLGAALAPDRERRRPARGEGRGMNGWTAGPLSEARPRSRAPP